jgi:hypothetical protein
MAIDRDIIEREVEQQLSTPMYGTNAWDLAASFYFYKNDVWHAWNAFHELGVTLFTGPLKPEYDYAGADVAVRVHGYVSRIMPRNDSTTSNRITWTAAARPMGYLEMDTGTREPPHTYGFVLPAFRDVRLIAIDTASNANQSLFDPEWWYHAYAGSLSGQSHVQEYLRSGPRADNGCPYCEALVQWEDPAFRQQILDWLDEYGYLCTLRPPGGRAGGGTQRGH